MKVKTEYFHRVQADTLTDRQTDLEAGEPSSRCADTAPLAGSRAGTCRLPVQSVWTEEPPASPGTRQLLAPLVGRQQRRPHIAPGPGTELRIGARPGTTDGPPRSRHASAEGGSSATLLQEGGRRADRMKDTTT